MLGATTGTVGVDSNCSTLITQAPEALPSLISASTSLLLRLHLHIGLPALLSHTAPRASDTSGSNILPALPKGIQLQRWTTFSAIPAHSGHNECILRVAGQGPSCNIRARALEPLAPQQRSSMTAKLALGCCSRHSLISNIPLATRLPITLHPFIPHHDCSLSSNTPSPIHHLSSLQLLPGLTHRLAVSTCVYCGDSLR